MSYENITIKNVLKSVDSRLILLPAIQRDYVWDEDQVVSLFDSIMKGFPIGSFLFWEKPSKIAYEFRRDYDPDDIENTMASLSSAKNADYLVLDGQQRLTSLYIGFYGSYISSKKRKNNYVYYNFSTREFALMDETNERLTENKWIKASLIATYKTFNLFQKNLVQGSLLEGISFSKTEKKNLEDLYNIFDHYELQFFKISRKESLTNVLDIFVRVNSGGEVLSKTDLLFSSIINDWEDGRKSVKNTIDEIRKKLGKSPKIDTDFVIKCVLYMSTNVDVKLKVENIQDNIDEIKKDWDGKIGAVKEMANTVYRMGFHDDIIVSYNALLPIAYWIYKSKKSVKKQEPLLKMFFVLAQLKQLFGSGSDTTLTKIRAILNKAINAKKDFPEKGILDAFDINCTANDVSAWLKFSYKNKKSYAQFVLSLLQPKLNYAESKFHLDHLHPQVFFKEGKKCKIKHLSEDERKKWETMSNLVPNLQLLLGDENQSKKDSPLNEWIKNNKVLYVPRIKKTKNYYDLNNFENFFKEREKEMYEALMSILHIRKKKKVK